MYCGSRLGTGTGDWGLGTGDWGLPAAAPNCGCWQCGLVCVSPLLDVSAVMHI